MIVIADTTPLNYLILIGHIEVLPHLYGHVVIPSAVEAELLAPSAPEAVRQWTFAPPPWLEVRTPGKLLDALHPQLDDGKRQAITLAYGTEHSILIIDELLGRREASRLGIPLIGTLGILKRAHDAGLLVLSDAIEKLRKTTFKASDELWKQFS